VESLTSLEKNRMFELLQNHFLGIHHAQFEQDLAEKSWVIFLDEVQTGQIQGFTTLMLLQIELDGHPYAALFSGDTIINREFWGETVLPRLWIRWALQVARSIPVQPVYWLLICSGYKTYRFLPLFYREFYPHFRQATPPHIQKVIDTFARQKFDTAYEPQRGIVRFANPSPLRAGVAEITPNRLKDPHIAFFAQKNPGHLHGDELVCLTRLAVDNLTKAGKRMLEGGRRKDEG